MKFQLATVGIGLALLGAPAAHAQPDALAMQWGRDALQTCGEADAARPKDTMAAIVCLAWINGAVQAATNTASFEPEKPDYCTPGVGGSSGQYAAVFLKFLRDNPAKRHLPAIYLFHQAMAEAFPCQ